EVRSEIVGIVIAEQRTRTPPGARVSVPGSAESAEYLLYRTKTLEKFVRSVLFLEIARGVDGVQIAETVAAIAAGVAMLLSTMIAAFAQRFYRVDTMPFVVIVVVAYMLKDRVKEWIKRLAMPRVSRYHADYRVNLQDERSGVTVGNCRELFSFVSPARLPP